MKLSIDNDIFYRKAMHDESVFEMLDMAAGLISESEVKKKKEERETVRMVRRTIES